MNWVTLTVAVHCYDDSTVNIVVVIAIIITIVTLVWRFGSVGNVVGRINEVNPSWLVLGCVTVCRRVNHLVMQPAT